MRFMCVCSNSQKLSELKASQILRENIAIAYFSKVYEKSTTINKSLRRMNAVVEKIGRNTV